jgi:hypothetical protein
MKLENRQNVVDSLKHFKKDLKEYGIFVIDPYPDANRHRIFCKFGEWPKQDVINPCFVGRPQLEVSFAHTEIYGASTEWGNCPEGVLFYADESLNDSYCGKNMVLGIGLLSVVENWGFDHGKFMHRSDSHGLYSGPHEEYPSLPRPHGRVSKHFLIHPEIYKNETR